MATSRYILRYRGSATIPADDIERIRSVKDVDVVDSTSRMLLVNAPGDVLKLLVASMPDWILSEERSIPLPDPRPKLR
jgi:hypothetical protein